MTERTRQTGAKIAKSKGTSASDEFSLRRTGTAVPVKQGTRRSDAPKPKRSPPAPPASSEPSPGRVRQIRRTTTTPVHRGRGPFYDLAGAAHLVGKEPHILEKEAKAGEALVVTTIEGVKLLPAWQFDGPRVHPHVAKILEIFHSVPVDQWMIVQWATAPDPQLGGTSAIQALHEGHDIEAVLADARRYAARWSQ
ncbi:hypothetical protein [Streptacidiphilus sp. EB103A]|uniref:hypothetical protein n=1 Tax=Streptacidiphilus sp. EB103A TaxID=3156275 RepID=UPI0035195D04